MAEIASATAVAGSRKTGSAVPPGAMLAASAIAARSLGLAES